MTNKKIVLIFPKESSILSNRTYREQSMFADVREVIGGENNYEVFREPLGIESIGAYLRSKGFEVKFFFCDLEKISDEEIVEYLKNESICFVGISVLFDRHLEHTFTISKKIRSVKRKLPIFLGGPLVSFAAKQVLEYANWISGIFIGEGEKNTYEVALAISENCDWRNVRGLVFWKNKEVVVNPPMDKIDLDEIPFPARDYIIRAQELGNKIQVASIYTSRGCAGTCTYCTGNQFSKLCIGKRWRGRSPYNVVDEIEELINKYNISYFYICDDNFWGYGKYAKARIMKILELLKDRNIKAKFHFEMRVDFIDEEFVKSLKECGFVDIFLGIESGVQSMLDRWKKGTTVEDNIRAIDLVRKYKLNLKVGYILFDEYTTFEELQENLDFIIKMKLNSKNQIMELFNPMQIFVGSELANSKCSLESINGTGSENIMNKFTYSYELRDKQVYLFWESVKDIIDKLNFYFNYFAVPYIYKDRKKVNKKECIAYLKKLKEMQNSLPDIVMRICYKAIDLIKEGVEKDEIKQKINEYYKSIETSYFMYGLVEEMYLIYENTEIVKCK